LLIEKIQISYIDRIPRVNRLKRLVWNGIWFVFFRPSPTPYHGWRRFLLRLFGARIGPGAHVYSSATVWAPWNLEMEEGSCLGPGVNCYCMAKIHLGAHATVSQFTHLCAAGHDIADQSFALVTQPIRIGANAWVATDAFIGPGVTVGEGAVVGARSAVFRDVKPWTVVGGNPARFLKKRILRHSKFQRKP
jgi:putative colanic acid biosynthesis acetyltransferase WcaF